MQFTLPIAAALVSGRSATWKWSTPVAASSIAMVSGWGGGTANTYGGVIGQPDVPRCLRYTFSNTWTGGNVTITVTFDGASASYVIVSAPGSNNVDIPAALFTTVTSITKTVVGAGTVSLGYGDTLGVTSGGANVDQFGIGIANGSTTTTTSTARADGRAVTFGLSPNGGRTFVYTANKV